MKIFDCLVFLLLIIGVVSQRTWFPGRSLSGRHGTFGSQRNMQVCEGDSTCLVWYRCPSSRLPRQRIYPPCFYEGYSKWDMGVCCANLGKGTTEESNGNIPITISSTTMAAPINPTNMDCGRSFMASGSTTRSGHWPWMVSIKKLGQNGTERHYCNGFLIDQRNVLTAAHCLRAENITLFIVRTGNIDHRLGKVYHIRRLVIPDDYRPPLFYSDIALLTLDRPVSTPNFNPICMPDSFYRIETGRNATFVGWAIVNHGLASNFLHELHGLSIISNYDCESIFRNRIGAVALNGTFPSGFTNDFICAALPVGSSGNCGGDSGGPLMIQEGGRWYAIGVLIFGAQTCDTPEFPSGYTRVSSFIDFVQKNI